MLENKAITTAIDGFLQLVKEEKEISFADAAQKLGVDLDTINFWADFLETDKLLTIKYNMFTPFAVYLDPENPNAIPEKTVKTKSKTNNNVNMRNASGRLDLIKKLGNKKEKKKSKFSIGDKLSLTQSKSTLNNISKKLDQALNQSSKGEFNSSRRYYAETLKDLKKSHSVISPKILELKPSIGSSLKKKISDLDKVYKKLNDNLEKKNFEQVSKFNSILADEVKSTKLALEKSVDFISTSQKEELKKESPEFLMEKVYELIKKKDLEEAKRIYEIVCEIYKDLPQDFERTRKNLANNIININKELGENLNKDNSSKVNQGLNKISKLIDKGKKELDKNNFDYADEIYQDIKELIVYFNNNQSVKVDEIRSKALTFHTDLLQKKQKHFSVLFIEKKKIILSLLDETKRNIEIKNKKEAIKAYERASYEFKQLPSGFVKEKINIYSTIIKEYEHLLPLLGEEVDKHIETISKSIDKLLRTLRNYYDRGSLEGMITSYREIKRLYDKIKYDEFKTKSEIHKKITKAYNSYILKYQKAIERSSISKINDIEKLITNAEESINRGNYSIANKEYNKTIQLLRDLPEEVLYMNKKLRERTLLVYRKLLLESPNKVVVR